MNAQQKIKHMILNRLAMFMDTPAPTVTAENVDALYNEAYENDDGNFQDARNEVRCSGITTDLAAPYSSHYEANAVAERAPDGSWVGWTYWYGGGKHGEPEAMDWIEYAYDLDCHEEQKLVTVRTFALASRANEPS